MKNIFIFIGRHFTFVSFVLLEIFSIAMLSKYSKTHEAFFSSGINETTGKINSQFNRFYTYFSLKEINRQLSLENAALRDSLRANFIVPDSTRKSINDTVRIDSLVRYRKFNYLPAKVVGNTISSQTNYLTLERGTSQGVKRGMSVVGPEGIVGVIVDVSENYSKAMSLLHRNSKVSAMLKKDNVAGSIEWDGTDPTFLILKNIPKSSKVQKGDTVLTSTYSANFPSHLQVGTISAIIADPTSNFYTLKVKTATNFFSLQYVNIIENLRYNEQVKLESVKPKNNE